MMEDSGRRLVYIGSDHAGFSAKEELKKYLQKKGEYELTDLGCFSTDSCDYPDVAREVAEKVLEHKGAFGVLLCGTGIGMSIAANKLQGIRSAVVENEKMAEMSRRHNDANVISMGAANHTVEELKLMMDKFLSTDFEKNEERHVRRVEKLNAM